jgi:hypothetical protein
MQFDLFDQLSNLVPFYIKIIICNYISINNLILDRIKHLSSFKNFNYNQPTFNQILFKSKVNNEIITIPTELIRHKYGYYSTNIYDRILKFPKFMNSFIKNYTLFDYIDIDNIIIQELNIDLRNEDSDTELDDDFNILKERSKKEKKTLLNVNNDFKYSQIYNSRSIEAIIESIIEIFMLDGYSITDYTLKSFTLNSLTKTDYMVLFNYNYIVDV